MSILVTGLSMPEVAATVLRVSMGVFFTISGYHKLFNPIRHATVNQTMVEDHVPDPKLNTWVVSSAEFCGGLALLVGFLTPLAALGLMIICSGACALDGVKRITSWSPLDKADYLDDVLYLPETLYVIILLGVMMLGAGPYSLDAYITSQLFPWWV